MGAEVTEDLFQTVFRSRIEDSHKGQNGVVLVVGGGWLYHGAPTLAALAALRSGVDLVLVAVPKMIAPSVRAISPNLIVLPLPDAKLTKGSARRLLKWIPQIDAAVVGPGLGNGPKDGINILASELVSRGAGIVLDADALRSEVLDHVKGRKCVLTPHLGEFKRLFGVDLGNDSVDSRAKKVKKYAKQWKLTILLKGKVDVISDGNEVALNYTGSSAMTVGGTGDVLSGLLTGMMVTGASPFKAAMAAAYVNGVCGENAAKRLGYHLTATDLIEEIPLMLKKYDY
ncbi:MAG: NAD(P)H-hydrate dehydratase [Nitrososphaerales archaeon]